MWDPGFPFTMIRVGAQSLDFWRRDLLPPWRSMFLYSHQPLDARSQDLFLPHRGFPKNLRTLTPGLGPRGQAGRGRKFSHSFLPESLLRSQADNWQPSEVCPPPPASSSSPCLPSPPAPLLQLNDFHMGLWWLEPSLPALSEISKFRRNMKIVNHSFLRG